MSELEQRTVPNGQTYGWENVNAAVPPSLDHFFLIYRDNLSVNFSSKPKKFVDYTPLMVSRGTEVNSFKFT